MILKNNKILNKIILNLSSDFDTGTSVQILFLRLGVLNLNGIICAIIGMELMNYRQRVKWDYYLCELCACYSAEISAFRIHHEWDVTRKDDVMLPKKRRHTETNRRCLLLEKLVSNLCSNVNKVYLSIRFYCIFTQTPSLLLWVYTSRIRSNLTKFITWANKYFMTSVKLGSYNFFYKSEPNHTNKKWFDSSQVNRIESTKQLSIVYQQYHFKKFQQKNLV